MSKESKLVKNTIVIAIGNICTKCISFFLLPLYTSILTTEEYGKVDLVGTYVTLLITIMTLQFEQGVFRFLIEVREDKNKKTQYISTSLITILAVNCLFLIIATPILVKTNYEFTGYLLFWVVIGSINSIILQIPRGLGDNVTYSKGSFMNASVNVILNAIFIGVFKYGMNSLLISSIMSLLVSSLYVAAKLKVWNYLDFRMLDKKCFINLTKYSLPLIPYTLCWWVVNASDRIIINIFIGTAANGIYAAAYKFPLLFSMVTNIFQLSWTESASEIVNDEKREEYYQKIINNTIKFYSTGNMFIIGFMPFIFKVLIKSDFVEAYNYVPILMLAALFHSISSLYCSIYFAFKKTKRVAITTISAAIINIIINIFLVKEIGLYAAAVSSVCAYIIITVISHIDVQKFVKIKIEIKYIFMEMILYMLVISAYYLNKILIQLIFIVIIAIYGFIQNREVIYVIIKNIRRKIKDFQFIKKGNT